MAKVTDWGTDDEMVALREGIKRKYDSFHRADRDRFPEIVFNTNRANYEPLRASFEEEFYEIRKIGRASKLIHIPSTKSLALIFTDNDYRPGNKILNTCLSYAEGKSLPEAPSDIVEDDYVSAPAVNRSRLVNVLGILGAIGLVLFGILYFSFPRLRIGQHPTGLKISRPSNGKEVPRELLAVGEVVDADTVWIVVRAKQGVRYWVQPPIKVGIDNTWRGGIYIGSTNKEDVGVTSQIRAFVNPNRSLKDGEVLFAWPEAELATDVIEVKRGEKDEY